MQSQAAADLDRLVTAALREHGLSFEGAASFVTPRRLALHVAGLPARQPDTREEKRGPRVGAPESAVQGFLKSTGLSSLSDAKILRDSKKGEFYVAVIERKGQETQALLADILPRVIKNFPWPKSMRWGASSAQPDSLHWIRPLHAIVATFGPDTGDPSVVPFAVDGIEAGQITFGHRFMAPGAIKVRRFDDYAAGLEKAKVILDPARRRDVILHDARDLALAHGLELIDDQNLLHEAAGLVEWPVVLAGEFDRAFLSLPVEVIQTTIRANQKCFVLTEKNGQLSNKFLIVANLEAADGGAAIVAGNARVVRARLTDAQFFYETDLKTKLLDRLGRLDEIIFHEKLGSQDERVKRLECLSAEIAKKIGAESELAARAARLAKADLTTEMVGEFPELQGIMGRYYALAQGEPEPIADAIADHYKPQGPSDRVPSRPLSIAVALADKLDLLTAFFAIDEKPTGSRDPYGLRRAALGVIALILENKLRLRLRWLFEQAFFQTHFSQLSSIDLFAQLFDFFIDRLKVYMRERGMRYDLIEAVAALGGDDLLLIVARVEALQRFLETKDGVNLLAGYRRATNIIRVEERADGAGAFDGDVDPALFQGELEEQLARAIQNTSAETHFFLSKAEETGSLEHLPQVFFERAMTTLSQLREPVDLFFEKVTVNSADRKLRLNRLRLLSRLRKVMHNVADFSKVV